MASADIKFKVDVQLTLWSAIKLRIAGFRVYADKVQAVIDSYLDSAEGRAKIQKIAAGGNDR